MQLQRKIFTTISIFVGVGVAFSVLVLYPTVQGIIRDNHAVIEQKQELLQINENKKRSHEFESISVQYAQQFLQVENLFVDRETPVSFFRFLDDTAASFNVQMQKSPGNVSEAAEDIWPSFTMQVVGKGTYENVLSFLQQLEHAPYLLQVRTLSMKKSSSAEKDGTVDFSLSVKVFVK